MTWNAPQADLQAVHPDWLEPIAERFGDGDLWRGMVADDALRPYLLAHVQTDAFGQVMECTPRLPISDDLDRVTGADGIAIVQLAGWFWYAPVLLPRLISRGTIPGLNPTNLEMMRAMRDWTDHVAAEELVVPGDNSTIERAGAGCRLAWIRACDDGIAQHARLQFACPSSVEKEIAEHETAQHIFKAALDFRGGLLS